MIALAPSVDLDAAVAHEDLAMDPTGDLVAGGDRRPQIRTPVGLPLEFEAERDPVPECAVVHVGRILQGDGERLQTARHPLQGLGNVVVGPQPVVADLERRSLLRQGGLVFDHRDEGPVGLDETRPVPELVEPRDEADAHVAALAPIR